MATLQTARPAPIWKRIVAGAIDFVALAMLAWPAALLLVFGDVDAEIESRRAILGRLFPYLFLMGLWLFPYCLRDLVRGRSLGKWLLGLRVVDSVDAVSRPGWKRLIQRNLTIWLSPVGLASAMMHPDRMRFGDRLARTMVVEDAAPPKGPSMRDTVLKAVSFALAAVVCMAGWRDMTVRYHEGSRVFGFAKTYLDGCAELRELMSGISSDNLTAANFVYGPTADGAGAQVDFRHHSGQRETTVVVVMTRPADNVAAWRGHAAQVQFTPPPVAENVTGSRLNSPALVFLNTYEPLHAAVRDLHPEKMQLVGAVAFVEKGTRKAAVWYIHPPDRWGAQVQVLLDPRDDAWEVADSMGLVDLNIDNATARRMFVFVRSKDAHRFLTADEMGQILQQRRPPGEVVPEFRAPPDNATGAK